jgi:uncharacterized protein YndB with AHSA1/START domain
MKWLKISIASLLGLILLTTAAMAIANMGADSNRIVSSMVFQAKPAAIWPWLYEPDKVKQWVSWLVEIRESGSGEPVPGGQAVWVMEDRNNNNMRMEITGTVQSVERYHRIAVALNAPEGFHGTSVYTLTEQTDGSTLLQSDSRYTFENGFARFMTPVVCWQAKKKMVSDLDHLRALLEAPPAVR